MLVAAVLLAVGVGGCLSALLAAARLRTRAAAREAVAHAVEARVAWFAAAACGVGADSLVRSDSAARVAEVWRVRRDSARATLEGGAASAGPAPHRRALRATRRCP